MENVNPNITNLRWDRCKKKRDRKKREKTKDIYVSDAVRKEQNDRKKKKVRCNPYWKIKDPNKILT